MRKIALLAAAVAGVTGMGSAANADFIYRINPVVGVGTGSFTGDSIYTLQIQGVATTTSQSTNAVAYQVTITSPTLFIRTWSSSEGFYDDVTPANNTDADLGNQGTVVISDQSSARPGQAGTSVRLGGTNGYVLASSTPSETSATFTDYGSIANSVSVSAANSTTNGNPLLSGFGVSTNPAVWTNIATAVVPTGTTTPSITFTGKVISTLPTDTQGVSFSLSTTPEPTSLAALGLGVTGLLARRRRA